MRLQILLISLLQVGLVEAQTEVVGYVGDNVTLPSGADPSWKLSRIDWSVFSNNTWIATLNDGKTNTERFHQYKKRLSLNTTSGDLTIHNLNTMDAMVYTVDLINSESRNTEHKIQLIVKQRLQKPTITTKTWVPSGSVTVDSCWVEARCSSPDEGVGLSWQVKPSGAATFYNSELLLVFLNTTYSRVEGNCTASRNVDNESRAVTLQCEESKPTSTPKPQPPQQYVCRNSYTIYFIVGAFVGCLLIFLLIHRFGKQNEAECKNLKDSQP